MALIGGRMWFVRTQSYNDLILKLQCLELEKKVDGYGEQTKAIIKKTSIKYVILHFIDWLSNNYFHLVK